MQFSGTVSVWFGISKSFQDLDDYVEVKYTEDGDSINSLFGTNFGFGYYDEDKIEVHFFEEPVNNLDEILKDFSYSESFIPSVKALVQGDCLEHGINSVILLYDLEDNILRDEDMTGSLKMNYIGTVTYIEE